MASEFRNPGPAVLPCPRAGEPPLPYVPVPLRRELENGLRVVAVRWGSLPRVVIRLVLPAGAARDPVELPGLAGLVTRLLTEGTARFSADELNTRLDQLGASLDVHAGHDFAELEMVLLSETLDEALHLLAELLTRPRFPEHEMERARHEVLDALDARTDEPANVADDRTAQEVFGETHPYGRPALGAEQGLREVSRKHLQDFHDRFYRPSGALLVAAGDLDPHRFADLLQSVLREWQGAPQNGEVPPVLARPTAAGTRIALPWPAAQQAELRVAGTGLRRDSPDWVAAAVANYLLGGSTITGRLGANLREDKGWTYGVRSSFSAGLEPGGWMVETAVDVEVREAALREIAEEIRRLVEEPVAEPELTRAQHALVLSLPRAFETPGRVVSRFVTVGSFGLPHDYWETFPAAVRAVTPDRVREMARRYFAPEGLVTVSVG